MNLEQYFDQLHKLAAQEKRRKQTQQPSNTSYREDAEDEDQGKRE